MTGTPPPPPPLEVVEEGIVWIERGNKPPTAEQTDAALAALTGTTTEQRPDTELARNMLRLRLVMEAKHKGVPWAVIGQALGGISAKAAKREMKALARETQRELLASRGKG